MNEKKEIVLSYLLFIPLFLLLIIAMYPTNKPTHEANLFINTSTARFGWHEVTLHSIQKKPYDATHHLLLLSFTLRNQRTSDSILYDQKNIHLRGQLKGSGISVTRDLLQPYKPSSTLGKGVLKPGESVSGTMGFLIPSHENQELQFRWHAVRGDYTILRINMNPAFMKNLMKKEGVTNESNPTHP